MKRGFFQKATIICLILPLLLLVLSAPDICCQERTPILKFFFYHPDSSQNNLSSLKSQMDGFFSQTGLGIQFQPFAHLADFDTGLRQQHPAFQWVPQWYVARFGEQLGLKPFLVAIHNGETTYRKVLVGARKDQQILASLQGRTMAMTSLGPERERLLGELLFTPNSLQGEALSIIEVPKDSDALLALMLGQVNLALVSEDNLRILSRMNAVIERLVLPLHKTLPISLPYLCYMEGKVKTSEVNRVRELFLRSENIQKNKELMEMLQVDAWQTLSH